MATSFTQLKKTIWSLCVKYKDIITYGIFGVLTTLVNIVVYKVCYDYLHIANVPSNIIAWVLAVAFAFVTNKLYVFDSKSWAPNVLKHELITFVGCRLATGVMDVAIMWVTVDLLHFNSTVCKLASNVLVIIINYIASKLVIFKKNK